MNDSRGERDIGAQALPVPIGERRMAILAEGAFSPLDAKTAVCLVRYAPGEVVAVIDSTRAPGDAQRALGFGGAIPVVATLADALERRPNMLVLGTAPRGGGIVPRDRAVAAEAIEAGLHVASGMHAFLNGCPRLAERARSRGVVLWDVRRPPDGLGVSSGRECPGCAVVLTVGSDCNTGKMTVAMEMHLALRRAGVRSGFAASGQTGILITGRGISIDRVISDFVGGATERLVLETAGGNDVVLLEGQGSILHPAYAGVTFGMIAGALPHGFVLCHQPTRTAIRGYDVPIPPLPALVRLYENAVAGIKRIPVVGIALNTFDLPEDAARDAVARAAAATGLPAADPVRFGAEPLATAIRAAFAR